MHPADHPSSTIIRKSLLTSVALAALAGPALASSHREAPLIAGEPRLDSSDVYMFRSYETGRQNYVTMIASYLPLQDPFGGPNYFSLDDQAVYDFNIDNVGDGTEHLTFRFRFTNKFGYRTVNVGGRQVGLPIENVGPVSGGDTSNQNIIRTYDLSLVRRTRDGSTEQKVTRADGGEHFVMPLDNIGTKSIPDYASYAARFYTPIKIPGCGTGRVFVGQRKDPFVIGLGQFFDLLNVAHPIGEQYAAAGHDDLVDKNVTSLVLEVPAACLVAGDPVIGLWTSASKIETASGGATTRLVQHSRLGNPLVNELLIAISDKDKWNAARPSQYDGALFKGYVTNPSYPAYVENLFGAAGVRAPTAFPRQDLVAVFLTGLKGLNQPKTPPLLADELRLNTSLPITPAGSQNRLGVIGNDTAGFPNGRRPGDDVVDITLRVAMGRLFTLGLFGSPSDAPSGALDFTDGALVNDSFFDTKFPYLRTPIAGSPGPQPH